MTVRRCSISSMSTARRGRCCGVLLTLAVVLVLAVALAPAVDADSTVSANALSKYWIDARDVLEDLDQYQALWVKVHGCV
jgi:hypothetical protein